MNIAATRTKRLVALALLAGLLLAAIPARSATNYQIRAVLSVTSDWAELCVDGAAVLVDWWAPDYDLPGLHVYTEPHVRIEKPCCSRASATVRLDLLVSPSDMESVSWTLSKGAYGKADLTLYALPEDDAEPVRLATVRLREKDNVEGVSRTVRVDTSEIEAKAATREGVDPASPTYVPAASYLGIPYASLPGVKPALLSLDLMLPPRDLANPPPLIISIHGGGMVGGDKSESMASADVWQVIGHSYALASINYRLMPDAGFPSQLHDVRGAIAWLRAHAEEYGYNGNRIGLWGFSAGGYLALLAGLTEGVEELAGSVGPHTDASAHVSAICSYYGTADFRSISPSVPWDYLGSNDIDFAAFASPVSHVTEDDPPVFLLHGQRDQYLPVAQAETLYALLQEASVPSELLIVRGAMHAGHTGWWGDGPRALRDFLDRHVSGR